MLGCVNLPGCNCAGAQGSGEHGRGNTREHVGTFSLSPLHPAPHTLMFLAPTHPCARACFLCNLNYHSIANRPPLPSGERARGEGGKCSLLSSSAVRKSPHPASRLHIIRNLVKWIIKIPFLLKQHRLEVCGCSIITFIWIGLSSSPLESSLVANHPD